MGTVEGVVAGRRALLRRAWLRVRTRRDGRPPLWFELAVAGWLFWLYDVINNLAPIRRALAKSNAIGLLSVEHTLHIDPELTLNHWLGGHATLGLVAAYYYFFAHGVVTAAALVCLWWLRPQLYPRLRTQLVIINLIAFVVFWRYPLAPPRMFPHLGYQDVIATSHSAVSWHSSALVDDADQFAAMPSLHVAWAIWSAMALWQIFRRRVVAVLVAAYPLLTSFVVLATGNHYTLDVIAGAASVPVAVALQRLLARAWASLRDRRLATRAAESLSGAEATVEVSPDGVGASRAGAFRRPRSAAPRR